MFPDANWNLLFEIKPFQLRNVEVSRYALTVMKPVPVKILGIYLIAICVLQIWLYLAMSFVDIKDKLWLLYFEPRIGIVVFVELFVRTQQMVVLSVLRWLLVVWTLALGSLMLSGRPLIKTYIVSEIILAIPSLLCLLALVVIVALNLNTAPKDILGMSIIPFLVAVFFTVIPLVGAFWLWLSSWVTSSKEKRKFSSEGN